MKRERIYLLVLLLLILLTGQSVSAQNNMVFKDSVVYRITFRDTIIYRYDTVKINLYVHADTVRAGNIPQASPVPSKKKGLMNGNNWGVGPTAGAYYSPYNGFDVNIGFGVQYFLFTLSGNRNPHMGHRKSKK